MISYKDMYKNISIMIANIRFLPIEDILLGNSDSLSGNIIDKIAINTDKNVIIEIQKSGNIPIPTFSIPGSSGGNSEMRCKNTAHIAIKNIAKNILIYLLIIISNMIHDDRVYKLIKVLSVHDVPIAHIVSVY